MIRRRSHGAVLGIGLLAAMTVAAQSQSWNLYNGDTSLPTIPFVGGAMSPTKAASVDLALGSASSPTPFVMDTGSTGIVVSSNFFTPGPNARLRREGRLKSTPAAEKCFPNTVKFLPDRYVVI